MNNQAQNVYLTTKINTASPGELTLMLYNGCLKFMKQAQNGIATQNYEEKNINIKKSQDIFDELLITLNYNYEISNNLSDLYRFMKDKLVEANVKMDQESLQVAVDLLTELRDTWVEALKIVKTQAKVHA